MPAIRLLEPADRPALDTFLRRHAPQAMFLRSNLAHSGIVDGDTPCHGRYAAAFENGAIVGVAAHYWNDLLILLAPQHGPALARTVTGKGWLAGIIGPQDDVDSVRQSLSLAPEAIKIDSREDLFHLSLDRLHLPEPLRNGRLNCRIATEADLDLLVGWRLDFDIALNGGDTSAQAQAEARKSVLHWIDSRSQFILTDSGRPVAGCCFNARLPDMVQIGNVWTPPALRDRGYAKSVVAGALRSARAEGAEEAVLFTAIDNVAARRAYLAAGFTRIGDYAIVLLKS